MPQCTHTQACVYFVHSFGFSAALPALNYWGTGKKKLAGHEVWHLSCKAHTCFQPRCLCKPQLEKDSKGASIGETICTLGWAPDYSFYLWEQFPFWLWMLKLPEDSALLPQVPYPAWLYYTFIDVSQLWKLWKLSTIPDLYWNSLLHKHIHTHAKVQTVICYVQTYSSLTREWFYCTDLLYSCAHTPMPWSSHLDYYNVPLHGATLEQ